MGHARDVKHLKMMYKEKIVTQQEQYNNIGLSD